MSQDLKPIPLWLSVMLFGAPGVAIYWGMYYGTPLLIGKGLPPVYVFPVFLTIPGILVLAGSLLAYKLEGRPWRWPDFQARFRLYPIKEKKAWLWIIGVWLICIISDESLSGIGKWLATVPLFAPPDYLAAPFNPLKEVVFPMTEFFGAPLKGNWMILMVWIPLNLISMIGEELMWRGYILPRQELTYGRWAWVVNGLLWAFLVHVCMKWHYIGMLPSMLLTPWLAQKMKNTSASAYVHIGGNVITLFLFLVAGVMGVGG